MKNSVFHTCLWYTYYVYDFLWDFIMFHQFPKIFLIHAITKRFVFHKFNIQWWIHFSAPLCYYVQCGCLDNARSAWTTDCLFIPALFINGNLLISAVQSCLYTGNDNNIIHLHIPADRLFFFFFFLQLQYISFSPAMLVFPSVSQILTNNVCIASKQCFP